MVKDQVDQGEIAIVDCPTGSMWADFLSKPQQGALFKEMRGMIMGCEVNYVDPLDPTPKSTEVVGEQSSVSSKKGYKRKVAEGKMTSNGLTSLKSAKTRAASAWISPQECVGQSATGHIKKVRWTDDVRRGRKPLGTSRIQNRSWSDVVAGTYAPGKKE